MRISACLIAKNEERCIERCINSFRFSVDEIILVDTGSTDNTVAIAQSLGAKVFHFKWINDFAAARNYAIEQATGDWILFLDCDEWFYDRDGFKLRALVNKVHRNSKILALSFFMSNIEVQDDYVQNMSYVMRLFRRLPQIRYRSPVHETLFYEDMSITGEFTAREEMSILHDGYAMGTVKGKASRNLRILLENEATADDNPHQYYYIGREFSVLYKLDAAYYYLAKYIESGFVFLSIGINYYLIAILVATDLKPGWVAKRLLDAAMAQFPGHPTLHLLYGSLYMTQDMLCDALPHQLRAMELYETYNSAMEFRPNLMEDKRSKLYNGLEFCYRLRGDYKNAAHYLMVSHKDTPLSDFYALYVRLTLGEPADDVIGALAPMCISDIELDELIKALHDLRVDEAFLFFYNKRYRDADSIDYYTLVMFIILGEYKLAFAQLLMRVGQRDSLTYLKKLMLCALLSGDAALIASAARHDARAERLLFRFEGDPQPLEPGDGELFAQILGDLLAFRADAELLERWLSVAKGYEDDCATVVEVLFNHGAFDKAADYQQSLFDKRESEQGCAPIEYYHLGRYLYYAKRYEESMALFMQAIARGYNIAHCRNFIVWMSEDAGVESPVDIDTLSRLCAVLKDMETDAASCNDALLCAASVADEDSAAWHYNRAELYTAMGKPIVAEEFYRKALRDNGFIRLLTPGEPEKHDYNPADIAPPAHNHACPVCGGQGVEHMCVNMLRHYRFTKQYDQVRMWLRCEGCGHLFIRERYDYNTGFPYNAFILSQEDVAAGRLYDDYAYMIDNASDAFTESRVQDSLLINANLDRGIFSGAHTSMGYQDACLDGLYASGALIEAERTFSVVVADDILEHTHNPNEVTGKLAGMVPDGGYLLLIYLCADTRYFGDNLHRNTFLTDSAINGIFSDKSIEAMLDACGLRAERVFDIPEYNGRKCAVIRK